MARISINSEIGGTVWQVAATVGSHLEVDDPIVVLESMKMEIPVAAPAAGVLVELLVKPGETVKEGQTVAVLET